MKVKCPGEFEKQCGQVVEAEVRWTDTAVATLKTHPNCRRRYVILNDCIAEEIDLIVEILTPKPRQLAIPLTEIDSQRKKNWVDFHPEEFCHRCGGVNIPSWYVASDRFNIAMGMSTKHRWNGIICPGCFVVLHEEATGLTTTWTVVPTEMHPFRHLEDI